MSYHSPFTIGRLRRPRVNTHRLIRRAAGGFESLLSHQFPSKTGQGLAGFPRKSEVFVQTAGPGPVLHVSAGGTRTICAQAILRLEREGFG